MAKVAILQREYKRERMASQYAARRKQLRAIIHDPATTLEQREAAVLELDKLPRNASPIRQRNRCQITGRPKGYYRKFGLARNKLREAAMRGEIPGLFKSSW